MVGVPDERWGEVCAAFVVLADAATTRTSSRAFCPERLARFKVPKSFHVVDALPRNSVGKVAEGRAPRAAAVAPHDRRDPHQRRRAPALARRPRHAPALLDAAERVFGEVGYPDASIVKITEAAGVAQGTFYLYFDSKKAIFDELVRDLNQRVRHAMKEGSSHGATRLEQELLGFQAYFRFTAEHPALYRIIRQAEFVSPEMLHYHYDRLAWATRAALQEAADRGRDRRRRPRGDGVGADGPRRADRHALDPLERQTELPDHGLRRARADHPPHPRGAGTVRSPSGWRRAVDR